MIPLVLPVAEFSEDGGGIDGKGSFRFTLWRRDLQPAVLWNRDERIPAERIFQYIQFIGVNPSTADETKDDATIRRCIGFATRWGFDALVMTNAFAWRDTKPEKMKKQPTAEGDPQNLARITTLAEGAGMIVACWGSHCKFRYRDRTLKEALKPFAEKLKCFRQSLITGQPEHPLYIPNDCELIDLTL